MFSQRQARPKRSTKCTSGGIKHRLRFDDNLAGHVEDAIGEPSSTNRGHRLSPSANDQRKPNILQVRASHPAEMHGDIQMGRASGIPSDSEVLDMRGQPWAAAVSNFGWRFAMFFA